MLTMEKETACLEQRQRKEDNSFFVIKTNLGFYVYVKKFIPLPIAFKVQVKGNRSRNHHYSYLKICCCCKDSFFISLGRATFFFDKTDQVATLLSENSLLKQCITYWDHEVKILTNFTLIFNNRNYRGKVNLL